MVALAPSRPTTTSANSSARDCRTCRASDEPPTRRSGYRPWRELLRRTFQIDVERCDRCGTRLKLRALLLTAASIRRYLRWLGEPTDPPSLAPAPPEAKSAARSVSPIRPIRLSATPLRGR